MTAVDFYPNFTTQTSVMSRHCKTLTARLINNAFPIPRQVAPPLAHGHRALPPSAAAVDSRAFDSIFQHKRSVRSRVRKALKDMDPVQRAQEDDAIQSLVLEAPWFKAGQSLCAYVSCASLREVDTSRILSEALSSPAQAGHYRSRKKLYVPLVEDRNSNMRMLKISNVEDLIANSMNILEPNLFDSDGNQREDVMQASEPVDFFILPGLAFDKTGRRLGRGGGYYDMFLKKYQDLAKEQKWKQPLLVGLAYSIQIVEDGSIPITPFDVPVDAIVSPAGFSTISPASLERF